MQACALFFLDYKHVKQGDSGLYIEAFQKFDN